MTAGGAHLIVFANEKGGTGKSTVAVQVAIAASLKGFRVIGLDLDHRQRTFARTMENRADTNEGRSAPLPLVRTDVFDPQRDTDIVKKLDEIGSDADLVVVDTPGRHELASLIAIGRAETLVTPLNDSFVDLDVIGQVSPKDHLLQRPSFYTRLIWDIRRERSARGQTPLDWIVLRNRLPHLASRNGDQVAAALQILSQRAGFRLIPGLTERVVYRELFPDGLSPLDGHPTDRSAGRLSNARRELSDLLDALMMGLVRKRPSPTRLERTGSTEQGYRPIDVSSA